jgi:hypothetical protein
MLVAKKGGSVMTWLSWVLLLSYVVAGVWTFVVLYPSRHLISYHMGMNLAMVSGGVIGIAVGIVLGDLFPAHYALATIAATGIAIFGGIVFGALVDYQTLITGVASGIMSGLMGPMVGVMAGTQALVLILFCSLLVYLSYGLLCFSLRS